MTAKEGGKVVVWGAGTEERDLLYISDLVDFVETAVDKQTAKFDLYNVGYGSSISIADLVKKIILYSNKDMGIEYDDSKPSIKTKLCLDINKARNAFGWSPKISIDEGIRRTIKWYGENE